MSYPALAISGGVDSMALAYLCSQLPKHYPDLQVADNPLLAFRAIVVDHGLREGSTEEAEQVAKALRRMGLSREVFQINWRRDIGKDLGKDLDVRSASNLESLARRARYRKLAAACIHRKIVSILLAHHEDDQYEGVLMRMVAGHRNRGLIGMRKANPIPECEGLYGASESGWLDDQKSRNPIYRSILNKIERRSLRDELRSTVEQLGPRSEDEQADPIDLQPDLQLDSLASADLKPRPQPRPSELGYLPMEDGGCTIYRPLLEFSKDRLIATCLENNIPWWEDHTNSDPTLTRRNAIRHMYRSCELPRALQKPSILAISKSVQRRAEAHDAEARRLLQRCVMHEFHSNVGALTVQLPDLASLRSRRHSKTEQRQSHWRVWKRHVAAIVIQRIIAIVSPETQPPPVVNLMPTVYRLFPSLAEPSGRTPPPKSFNIGGVNFTLVEEPPQTAAASVPTHHPQAWYVSRQPYVSTDPLPCWRVPYWSKEAGKSGLSDNWEWSGWMQWKFWDGRFWARLSHRLPYRVVVMPFMAEHAKEFRDSLPPADRKRLARVLGKHAPGKVRYTLPAIYSEEHLDLRDVRPRRGYPLPEHEVGTGRKDCRITPHPFDLSKMRLLALPTLDIQLPELNEWLSYEIRYKKVDRNILLAMGSLGRGIFTPRRRRKPTIQGYQETRKRDTSGLGELPMQGMSTEYLDA